MTGKTRAFLIKYATWLLGIILLSGWPVFAVLISVFGAEAAGCELSEAEKSPCILWGTDFGDTFYGLFVTGWFGLVTIPLGVLAFMVWFVMFLIRFNRLRKE